LQADQGETFYEEARISHICSAVGYRRCNCADRHKHAVDDGSEHILIQHIDGDTEHDRSDDSEFDLTKHYRSDSDTKFDDTKFDRSVGNSELDHTKYYRSDGNTKLNYTKH